MITYIYFANISRFMKRQFTLFSFLMITFFALGQADGFEAHIIGGISAAQIRGDDISGFNKVGIESGIGVNYDIRYNMNLGLELLYSQRGSRSELTTGGLRVFRLDYLSIPVVLSIKDWIYESEEGLSYYRVMAQGGLSYGRLLKSKVEGPLGTIGTEELTAAFNQDDISWLVGLGYQFTYHLGANMRYNRSITKLFKTTDHPAINFNDLLPFHLSLQLTYKL